MPGAALPTLPTLFQSTHRHNLDILVTRLGGGGGDTHAACCSAALLLLCCWRRYCAAVHATPAGGSARAAEKGAGSAGSEAMSER